MENIRPNNNKSKSPQKEKIKRDPVIKKSSIVSSKKSMLSRVTDRFLYTDSQDIKRWLLDEVIIPGLKDTLLDFTSMLLNGEVYYGKKRRGGSKFDDRGIFNYGGIYSSGGRRNSRHSRNRDRDIDRYYNERNEYDYRAIKLHSYGEAQEVVDKLRYIIREEGCVSIASFFEILDVPSNFNDNNWGWTSERQIGIRSMRDGFLIDVDEAEYIG